VDISKVSNLTILIISHFRNAKFKVTLSQLIFMSGSSEDFDSLFMLP
jgi:hypothetical protein